MVDDTDDCLAVREAGIAGGPIEVLFPAMDVRVLAPAEGTLALEGVPVLEADALEAALIGFVGDLVGDYRLFNVNKLRNVWIRFAKLTRTMLVGRDVLGTGLGLGAFKLFRLASMTSPLRAVFDAGWKLAGRPIGFRAGAAFAAGGCAIMVAIMGLTNMP